MKDFWICLKHININLCFGGLECRRLSEQQLIFSPTSTHVNSLEIIFESSEIWTRVRSANTTSVPCCPPPHVKINGWHQDPFLRWANPGLFFIFFVFCSKNLSSQQDSSSDRRSRRQECWPLDQHNGPIVLFSLESTTTSWSTPCTSFCVRFTNGTWTPSTVDSVQLRLGSQSGEGWQDLKLPTGERLSRFVLCSRLVKVAPFSDFRFDLCKKARILLKATRRRASA